MGNPESLNLEFTTYYNDELAVRAGIADGLTDSSVIRFFEDEDPLTLEECAMFEEVYLSGIADKIEETVRQADALARCALADPSKLMIALMHDDEMAQLFSDEATDRLNTLIDLQHGE